VSTADVSEGEREPFEVTGAAAGAAVVGSVWASPALDGGRRAPLLVVHDGPAYDREAGLTAFLQEQIDGGTLPALRVALLEAGPRDIWYSANPDYATTLAEAVLPFLRSRWPTSRTVGLGASLGALAWLHAQSSYPEVVDGLFLQSGSFFRPDLDGQESGFSEFPAIVRFVRSVHRGRRVTRPVPAVMTCGAQEENFANNRRMARILRALKYPVVFAEVPGGHDYPSWRGAFETYLPDLVRASVSWPSLTGPAATIGPA